METVYIGNSIEENFNIFSLIQMC